MRGLSMAGNLRWAGLLAIGLGSAATGQTHMSPPRPNILVIVADDLGYSDMGAFGGEIQTPNLDAIAARGVKFTGFYTAPTCSPTRAMLLSGVDNHQAGLGTMGEVLTPNLRGRDGYEGHLNNRVATLAERLGSHGYLTLMSGKWHLGAKDDQIPAARGFERSFALLQGAHNHFGMDQGPEYRAVGSQTDYRRDRTAVTYPVGAFSSDYFAQQMIDMLDKSASDKRPFFAYLAFTSPHWPLQAPAETIAKYRGRYDSGPAALREERMARMKALGIIPENVVPHPVDMADWNAMTAQERAIEARKMEIYAAMVDRMDQNIGHVVAALKREHRLDNTLIIFMSDNGPEGLKFSAPINLTDPRKPVNMPVDNSLDNLGQGNSYTSYGPDWAAAASAPYWGIKSNTSEGGIHSPALVAGPNVRGGRMVGALLHVTDVVPTVLAATATPTDPTLNGHAVLPPEGLSLVSLLAGSVPAVRGPKDELAWELFYKRAIRRGNFKAVFQPNILPMLGGGPDKAPAAWQLFDLSNDPGETRDIAAQQPALLKSLIADWRAYAIRTNVAPMPGQSEWKR